MSDFVKKLPKLDFDKSKNILMIVAVIVIIYMIVVFGKDIVSGIEGIFGVAKNPVVDAAAQAGIDANMSSANPSSPFSPALYNNNQDASTLDYGTLQDMATKIYNSGSSLPNWLGGGADGQAGLAQFKKCNNKVDVSNLVVVFEQMYGKDLYDFISAQYTTDTGKIALSQILTFVNNLPTT